MVYHKIKIPIDVGQTIQFDDGLKYKIVESGESGDEYIVESDGESQRQHIDWFYDQGWDAEEIHITNMES